MFRAHRPIFRRARTAVHTTIGSVSVPLCSRALYVVACLGDYSLLSRLTLCVQSWTPDDGRKDRPKHVE